MILEIELRDGVTMKMEHPRGTLVHRSALPGDTVSVKVRYQEDGPVISEKRIRLTDHHGALEIR